MAFLSSATSTSSPLSISQNIQLHSQRTAQEAGRKIRKDQVLISSYLSTVEEGSLSACKGLRFQEKKNSSFLGATIKTSARSLHRPVLRTVVCAKWKDDDPEDDPEDEDEDDDGDLFEAGEVLVEPATQEPKPSENKYRKVRELENIYDWKGPDWEEDMHEVKKVYFEPEQATDVSTAEEDYEGINWRAIQEPTTWWQKLSDKVNETLDLSTAGTYPEPWWPYTNRSLYFSTHDVRLGYFKFDLRMEDNVGVFLEHMKMRAMELDIFGWASYTDTGARGECQGRIVSLDRMKVWLEKVSCPGASVIELIITDEKAGIDDLAYTCFEKRYDHPAYEKKFGQPAWWEPDYDPEAYAKRNNLPPPPKLPEGYQTIDDIFPRKRFQKKKETASAAKKKAAGKGRKGKGRRDSKSELDVLERDVVEDEVETVKMTPKEAEAFTLATAGISEIVAKNKSVEEVFMSEGPPMADETVEERVGRYCRAMGYDLERERAILGVLLSLTDEQKTELLAMKSEIEAS